MRRHGRAPEALAYWDAVAALNTPTDMAQYVPVSTTKAGGTSNAATLNQRRDHFLGSALDAL